MLVHDGLSGDNLKIGSGAAVSPDSMDSAITADQLVEKAKAQRKSDRCEDALRTATRATEIEPDNAEAWWQVALNTRDLRGSKAALAALRRTTELAPHFAYGWTLLGQTLLEVDKPKSARVCFEGAIRANPEEHNALLELAEIYRTSEETDRELDVLQTLDRLDLLDGWRLNRLGILHHQAHRFYKAIDCYKRVAALDDGPAGLFNLGLAYKEISQDADAIDCWRRCVTRYPDYARAGESLRGALPRMVALAAKVRERKIDLLDDSQRYSHYINPFELLNLPRGSDVVASARGHWARVADERKRDLGDMLADDFIECRVGSRGLYYDPFTETFLFPGTDGQLVEVPGFVRERVKTTVKRRTHLRRTAPRGGQLTLSDTTDAAKLVELARRRAKVLV